MSRGLVTPDILAAREALNLIDFGVSPSTAVSLTGAIKEVLDSRPGRAFYVPPGDWRLDTELVISKGNTLILADDARIYAGAAMPRMMRFFQSASGYAEDKAIIGGLLDGNLMADTILSVGKVIHFTLAHTRFRDGVHRGLVTEAGPGAEVIAYDLRFWNTTTTNVEDNIAVEANMGDSHFRDVITRDWTCGIKDTGANRWDRVHPWIGPDISGAAHMTARYPTSVGFDITGSSDLGTTLADTFRTPYKIRSNGTSYTPPPRLMNTRAMWGAGVIPDALAIANPACIIDNTDGVGAIVDRMTVNGVPAAPVPFLKGPSAGLTARNTYSYGYILGADGTTAGTKDYENGIAQGTFAFTPTIYGSTGAGTHTYDVRTGRMIVTKDVVQYLVRVKATLDSTTGFAGALRIGGLALPVGATNIRDGAGQVGYSVNAQASGAVIFGGIAPYISVLAMGASGTAELDIPTQALRGKNVDLMVAVTTTVFRQ